MNPGTVDSDSSTFSHQPGWPEDYLHHIREQLRSGRRVLVSTHAEVREALRNAGIPFTLVYPDPSQRDEYRARMEARCSSPALIQKVIDELWFDALAECRAQTGCTHVVLGPGEYLSDVLALPRAA